MCILIETLENMSKLSKEIYNDGFREGRKKGRKEGRKEGRKKEYKKMLKKIQRADAADQRVRELKLQLTALM